MLRLAPVNFRRRETWLVSCYAFFKWWLPLSQHPSCPCFSTSFNTQRKLRDLNWRSGLLPFWPWNLSPTVWLPGSYLWHSEFNRVRYHYVWRLLVQCSTSIIIHLRLALKLFRGEPAITRLDWNFTTSHNSSAGVSTNVGSDLHRVSPLLHPDHG